MAIAFNGMENFHTQNGKKVKEINQNEQNVVFKKLFDDMQTTDILQTTRQKETKSGSAPEIGWGRVLFHRFTKEQTEAVNQSGKLPKNAKFTDKSGKVNFTWNIADITTGTHDLPKGYELKNDIFGFTHVVREGTKNLFIR